MLPDRNKAAPTSVGANVSVSCTAGQVTAQEACLHGEPRTGRSLSFLVSVKRVRRKE
jgi:hypothetical protein